MIVRILILAAVAGLVQAAAQPSSREQVFQQRTRQIIDAWAAVHNPDSQGYGAVAARLWIQRDAEWCSNELQRLLYEPSGDMFWMFPVTAIAYLDRGQLTPPARQALRQAWKTYMPFRGDTENHWLLYYTTLYLMAQLHPNDPGSEWFNGKSSAENLRESAAYIRAWMDLTATKGQGEYDCTHYIGVYLLPLSYLAHWAKDADLKKRATMMIDYITADFAAENLNGFYGGAHARTDDVQVLERWAGVSSEFGWLLFGLGKPLPGHAAYAFYYSVASARCPPEIIYRIATDRTQPFTHRELKRTRHRWRFHDQRNGPVYKTTYVRREYVAGSDQGGVLQPIQQHSWDLTWNVPDGKSVHNTIFSMHPYSSVHELQTYFTGMPDFITESVVRSKRSYDSPDKFLGGSPFERIAQDRDTIIALYNIPAGTRWPHIHGFFSKDLRQLTVDPSGWIFAQGGEAFLAYFPLAPWEWRPLENGGKRLFSPHLKNGTILQAAAASEFPSFEAFREAVKALPLETTLAPVPRVKFRTLRGRNIDFTWDAPPVFDGIPLDYSAWKLFEGPFLNGEPYKLTLTHGDQRLVLDFQNPLAP